MQESPPASREIARPVTASSGPLGSEEHWLVGSLMLAMAVAALEQTVVSPAMPSIIAELHGFAIYPWVFSAYLLAATVSTPVYGKLADLWGRKRLLLFGLALFSLGSVLSGLSWSMPALIVNRVLQGLGAGAIMPIVLTILGDAFSLERRARVQGWFSAVWGLSSLIGPAIGGVLTDRLSWRWVFFVTLPFSLFAGVVLTRKFPERRAPASDRKPAPVDWLGAMLLTVATSALLFGLLSQERGKHVVSPAVWLGLAAVATAVLLIWERRAPDPILPLDLLAHPTVGAGILGSLLMGCLIFGIDTYIPLYIQGVMGGRATDAGWLLTPLFLSWAISVAVAAKIVGRLGFRRTALIGNSLITVGIVCLVAGATAPTLAVGFFLVGHLIIGLGMGPTSLSYILAVQYVVSWNRRGVATGALSFFRTIGGALGVTILGAFLSWGLARRVADPAEVAQVLAHRSPAVAAAGAAELPPSVSLQARTSLGAALRDLLAALLVVSVVGLECARRLPSREATRRSTAVGPGELAPGSEVSNSAEMG